MCALIWAPRDGPNYMCGCATSTVPHLRKTWSSITLSDYKADIGPYRPGLDLIGSEALPTVPATLYKLLQLKLCRLWLTWRGVTMTMLTDSLKVTRSGNEHPQFSISPNDHAIENIKCSRFSQIRTGHGRLVRSNASVSWHRQFWLGAAGESIWKTRSLEDVMRWWTSRNWTSAVNMEKKTLHQSPWVDLSVICQFFLQQSNTMQHLAVNHQYLGQRHHLCH